MKKTYETDKIKVYWEAEKCIHSTNCWKKLPEVFKPKEKPWIQTQGAAEEAIARTIDTCPSGALSYEWKDIQVKSLDNDIKKSNPMEPKIKIQVSPNGPILIQGPVELVDQKGEKVTKANMFALCRCGASVNKPYCDGSHHAIQFKDED